jgi:hypothetical protein
VLWEAGPNELARLHGAQGFPKSYQKGLVRYVLHVMRISWKGLTGDVLLSYLDLAQGIGLPIACVTTCAGAGGSMTGLVGTEQKSTGVSRSLLAWRSAIIERSCGRKWIGV